MYLPLLFNTFRTIELDIRDQYGSPPPFDHGTLTAILYFRRTNWKKIQIARYNEFFDWEWGCWATLHWSTSTKRTRWNRKFFSWCFTPSSSSFNAWRKSSWKISSSNRYEHNVRYRHSLNTPIGESFSKRERESGENLKRKLKKRQAYRGVGWL